MSKQVVKIKLIRGLSGRIPKHRQCIRGLGLRRIGDEVSLEDTPSVRGMINKVNYMLNIEG